jgi:uncharacterized hydrophobic protein (TIGR00271 family)
MSFTARFQVIEEKDKAAVVRKLLESSTPSFDFFYLVGLSVTMATLGLLADSPSIVIGSMLIAPLLYPILGVALGLVMSNMEVLGRSMFTLVKSLVIALGLSVITTLLFGDGFVTQEMAARIDPSLIHFMVAVVAGAAVSFALAQPEWSETLPGIAISVALIPPLAVVGAGIAMLDMTVVTGSLVMLLMNLFGIIFSAMVSFSLMNLYEKQNIATSTIKRENRKQQEEQEAIAAVMDNGTKKEHYSA